MVCSYLARHKLIIPCIKNHLLKIICEYYVIECFSPKFLYKNIAKKYSRRVAVKPYMYICEPCRLKTRVCVIIPLWMIPNMQWQLAICNKPIGKFNTVVWEKFGIKNFSSEACCDEN